MSFNNNLFKDTESRLDSPDVVHSASDEVVLPIGSIENYSDPLTGVSISSVAEVFGCS